MTFKEWIHTEDFGDRKQLERCWNKSRNSTIEKCAQIARNHPVFFKSGNMKSADIVRREIAEAIEKSREA